jgi:hypothetical protein
MKNCIPIVTIIDGIPILVTKSPLKRPTIPPVKILAIRAIKILPVVSKVIANIKPDKAITEGNDRSISPMARIIVSPKAITPTNGTVERNDLYICGDKNTSGLVIINRIKTIKAILIRPT